MSTKSAQTDEYLLTIKSLHKQFLEAFNGAYYEINGIEKDLRGASEIIIAGMGGSSFGGRVLISAFADDNLVTPVSLATGYRLPAYADEKTLVVITSYSGNTEETLTILDEARSRGCKIACITSGGKLEKLMDVYDLPGYIFDPKYGTGKVPRTGIGYVTGSTLGILSALGYLKFTQQEAKDLHSHISSFIDMLSIGDRTTTQITQKFVGKMPVFIASEHLFNGAHIWRNFLNETAKSMGFVQEVPYMNHHFLDGLFHPPEVKDDLLFVLIKSKHYNKRDSKRLEITKEILNKHNLLNISISLTGETRLYELWELIVMGCVVSYNLAKIYAVNPSTNEMVDYLKEQLAD